MGSRRRTDRLYGRTLGPREREALDLIEQNPGLIVADLADALGVGMTRTWQIVGRLEAGRVLLIEGGTPEATRRPRAVTRHLPRA